MKVLYNLIVVMTFSGLIISLSSCKGKQTSKEQVKQPTNDNTKIHAASENIYPGLRDLALRATPEQLNITIPAEQTRVFGVVMDMDLGEGTATFVSFETGEASMYLSSGGGDIGGGGHENIKNAAKIFVRKAQGYLNKMSKIDSTPLPDKNCVRFYLLTNKGRFTAQEKIQNFDNNTSVWLPLFEEADKVITEIRIIDEKMLNK